MRLDIMNVPFTRRNSYMEVSYCIGNFESFGRKPSDRERLHLRSVRGNSREMSFLALLVPTVDGQEVPYTFVATEAKITVHVKGGTIGICFADENTLLFQGKGKGIGLRLDNMIIGSGTYSYDYIFEIPYRGKIYYQANLFKNKSKYILMNEKGDKRYDQEWDIVTAKSCLLNFEEREGEFLAVIEEAQAEWNYREYYYDFEECVGKIEAEVLDFVKRMPEVPEEYGHLRELAGYLIWCSGVKKDGYLTRNAIYPSNYWMSGACNWSHCFAAMGLAHHLPELAWEQFMLLFDYQDDSGRIPDAVTDAYIMWNFCKPPIHGWVLLQIMEHMDLTREQLQRAYEGLSKWTNWWYDYRDNDRDGVCEYYHGADSGWDNSTVFRKNNLVESPELSAFLVLQEEALSVLAGKLGKWREADDWKVRSERQLEDLLRHNFDGDKPVALAGDTHEVIGSDSLQPYLAIILGRRLPKEKADDMLGQIKTRFKTEYGIATEKADSCYYEANGHWRGSIWAPSTFMVLHGLYELGERDFVKEVVEEFVAMVEKSGFSESFDSRTGVGNGNRAVTWTASVFLLLANQYLKQ